MLAMAVMLRVGMFVEEVFRLMTPLTFPGGRGGTVLTINSNSRPGWLVFSSAAKAGLALSGAERVSGCATLLTMRKVVALVGDSDVTKRIAYWGVTSIDRQMVPWICNATTGWLVSLQVTVMDLPTCPLKLALLNSMGMDPVFPGSTFRDQSPAVVQPQV